MAVHELSTNAAKHGALSVPAGTVEVIWSVQIEAGGNTLVISGSSATARLWRRRPAAASARSCLSTC